MSKLMFTCSRCGFVVVVERTFELELAGWQVRTRDDGTKLVTCSDCSSGAVGNCEADEQSFSARNVSARGRSSR